MKKASFITVLLAVLAFGSVAQESNKHPEADYQVVYQLLESINLKELIENNNARMVEMQIQNIPALNIYRHELLNFMTKYMSYEVLKKELANIYLKYYTIDEIKELLRFYTSPVGRKLLRTHEQLTSNIMRLSRDKFMANQEELRQIMIKKRQETEKNKNNGAEQ